MNKQFNYEYIPLRDIYIICLTDNDNYDYTYTESILERSKINHKIYKTVLKQYNAIYPDNLIDPIFKIPYFEFKEDVLNCIEKLNSILMIIILNEN